MSPADRKLDLTITIKPALTIERIRDELAGMVGTKITTDTSMDVVRRLSAMSLFDFSIEVER